MVKVNENETIKCICGCTRTRKRNMRYKELSNTITPIYYTIHCVSCDKYLGKYDSGQIKLKI